jgi:hypothetical protein
MGGVPLNERIAPMGMKFSYVRAPTLREKEALRARSKAKAAKEAERLAAALALAASASATASVAAFAKEAERLAAASKKAVADADAAKATAEAQAFGLNERWRAVNLTWREWASGATHVEAIATGFVPDKGFADIKARVDETLTFHSETGQRYSKFFANKDGERIGSGFFDSDVTATDIPYLFAALAAHGFEGHVAYRDPHTGSLSLDHYPPVDHPMPAFGDASFSLPLRHRHDTASSVEYLRFEAKEQLPNHFAAMWHAERERYRTIWASCKPRNFLVYDVLHKTESPMEVYEMRGEFPFKFGKVAEAVASDGKGGGFVANTHGSFFDDPPSPEVLAFISCRLAATGRWIVLVPHQNDSVTPEVHALMSGMTVHGE